MFDKKFSTKNLYLAFLATCSDRDCYRDGSISTKFEPIGYILVKKVKKDYKEIYADIFTHTKYEMEDIYFHKGRTYIRLLVPCVTNKNYITYEEATKILKYKNPNFLDLTEINKPKDKPKVKVFSKK